MGTVEANRFLAVKMRPIKDGSRQIGVSTRTKPVETGMAGVGGMMGYYHGEGINRRIMDVTCGWDLEASARDAGAALAIPNLLFAEAKGPALEAFLNMHRLTVVSLPTDQHVLFANLIFGRPDSAERYLYLEKPASHTVEGAIAIRDIERKFPGRIGVVAQNMLWDQAMEMRHRSLTGELGNIFQGRYSYRQDWINWMQAVNSRVQMGPGALPIEQAGIGKLSDILIHVLSMIRFTTGQRIASVERSFIHQHIFDRPKTAAGATFGAKGAEATAFDKVGLGTNFFGDDALYAVVKLENGAVISINIDQSAPGEKNSLLCELSGRKGKQGITCTFNTDNPDELVLTDLGNTKRIEARDPNALTFTSSIAPWIKDGLQMNNPPLRWFTPPRHGQGWKEVHQRQLQSFALYAQLRSLGLIDDSAKTRNELFFVSTAQQALNDILAMQAIYASGASGKPVTVDYSK